MCGRFTLVADPDELRAEFPWVDIPEGLAPRYNIAPSQPVAVIPNDGKNRLDYFLWGLIPSWAKDPAMGARLINARAETLAEKPSFRSAFRRRRCLIPASGFFEWKLEAGRKSKIPLYIRLKSGQPFALAGLWERWDAPDGATIFSCSIITTQPNELMQGIHNRMPVILPSQAYALWLEATEAPLAKLTDLLKPYPASEMTAYPVSTLVNSPANDLPACIEPATA